MRYYDIGLFVLSYCGVSVICAVMLYFCHCIVMSLFDLDKMCIVLVLCHYCVLIVSNNILNFNVQHPEMSHLLLFTTHPNSSSPQK